MKKRLLILLSIGVSVFGLAVPSRTAIASAVSWNNGDVFAAVGLGNYKIYDNNGVGPKDIINNGTTGVTAGCSFNPAQDKLYTTDWNRDNIIVYDRAVPHGILQTINTTGAGGADNESVVFANDGSFYVGHADGNHHLMHFSASGTLLTEFAPATEGRGTDWNDLASDQKTMYYTSEGKHVKRFDVSTGTQLSDFAGPLSGSFDFALRLLPPGDGSGGLLVADWENILRLDAAGNVVRTYTAPGESGWFALNLDPNGTSFWSGSLSGTGNFYRFNIDTGAIEVGPIVAGMSGFGAGLCLLGETTAAVSNITLTPASATNPTGTNHTVTATVTTNGQPTSGVLVSFSITSGPDTGASGTCSADATCHTDTNGQVSFTYTNNGTSGTDTIQACFTDSAGVQHCAKASKTWKGDAPIAGKGTTFGATEGQPFAGTVATVTDGDALDTPGEYTATIDWGDGSPVDTVIPTGPPGGPYNVDGSHTYQEEGTYRVKVHVTDSDSTNTADAISTARVADAALSAQCAMAPSIPQSYSGPTATFNDQVTPPAGTLSDFSATINWGDGFSSPADGQAVTIAGGPSNVPYTVSGSHIYASTGFFTVTTSITDVGGSTASARCTELVFALAPGVGGSFVIGDLEQATGTHVMFWGAQWWKNNATSVPSKAPSFKGFAESPSTPSCGAGWSADPGNSTPPPSGPLPAFMAVIVTDSYAKSGSTISGDTVHIVIVQTDSGYQPNPGHPGTGTVVAQVC